MVGIFDAFEVYNRKKHSSHPDMFGHTSNTGGTRTDYVYASEHRPAPKKKLAEGLPQEPAEAQKLVNQAAADSGMPHMVDISKLSQHELEDLMKSLRKGEPNNRVNF